jgi:flagellar hook-associated protein 3 FlgL
MRITNNIIQRNALAGFQANLRQVEAAQRRVSSGLRIERASEDPVAATGVMQAGSSLRALDQYRRNIGMASTRAAAEEGVLDRVTEVLTRARELAISQGSDTASAQTRATTKAEVDQLLEFVIGLGNTRVGESYLFGGDQAAAPFSAPSADPPVFATTPPTGAHQVEISSGQYLKANHNGTEVFLDTGTLQALYDLSAALGAGDGAEVRDTLAGLENAFNGVQNLLGDIGARSNQLQVTTANLDALEINLRTFKSNLEEVDLERAVTELVGRQTAFQAAMLATSRVMGMTLTDYLR